MRGYAEPVNILSGQALNTNGKTVISDPIPVGEGWYRAYLRINLVLTIGTGTGATAEGELNIIKNVLLKTDRGEIICNLPGRALYKIATLKLGSPPRKDAIAAASATYSVSLPIFFADHQKYVDRPEDTVLDTKRYSSITLEITLGTTADLVGTPGTSTYTANLDMEVFRTKGRLPQKAQPIGHISYDLRPPVDAASQTIVYLERAADLVLKRIYVHSGTSGVAGVPWSGANSDAVQNVVNLKDQSGFIVKDRIHAMILNENKDYFSLESVLVGVECHDFITDGSIQSALMTAGKPLLQYNWTNQGGVGANSIVTVTTEAVRSLK